jgi:signal transduction histidine kinase
MEYCFALSHDDGLVLKFNRALMAMKKDGTYQKLYNKWFPSEMLHRQNMITIAVVSLLIIILLVMYGISFYLRKKIKQITHEANIQNTRFQKLYDHTVVGLEYYDKDGLLIDMNQADCDIFGIPDRQAFIDYHMTLDDNPVTNVDVTMATIRPVAKVYKFDFRKEFRNRYFDPWTTKDEIVYVDTRIFPIYDQQGTLESIICTSVDVTEQCLASEALEESKINLEKEKTKAETADRLKSAFLANMSHEIRTPLNAIVGFSELLQNTEDPAEKQQFVNIINQNNALLLSLIGDILDLSKIESGAMSLKPEHFDLTEVYSEIFNVLKERYSKPDVEFRMDNPLPKCIIFQDKERTKQVIWNYLTNAVKYTNAGFICLKLESVDGGVKITVQDTGIGIPADKHDRLFKRFEKIDDFAKGTGLGLSICKAIVEKMEGRIGFTSEEGKGSTFWAWIPGIPNEDVDTNSGEPLVSEPKVLQSASETMASKVRNILIAEDNDSNFLLDKALLKDYSITRAITGVEAVSLAGKIRFDIILMDIKMPQMDGLEATRKIREFDKVVPIVALTANAFDSDRENALKAGCNAFLSKPFSNKELESVLANHM